MTLSEAVQQLYSQWWYGGILVPFLVTATIGCSLAIYTGLVTARLMMFVTEIQRCRERLLSYLDIYNDCISIEDDDEAANKLMWPFFAVAVALGTQQGQVRASERIQLLSKFLEEGAIRSRKTVRRGLGTGSDAVKIASLEHEKLRDASMEIYKRLNATRPNFFVIAGAPTFGRWFRQIRYRFFRITARWRRIKKYLNGDLY